jgi:membrane protein DedA with SNARE-associated domain
MEEFLLQYGYIALSIGTFLEGETAILVASSLVHSGFFQGPYTVIFGFFGSFVSDWLYFIIGRLNGKFFVDKRPKLKAKLAPVEKFFKTNRLQILSELPVSLRLQGLTASHDRDERDQNRSVSSL